LGSITVGGGNMQIGLLVIATNKYIEFLPNLLKGVKKNFLKKHDIEVFLFTNHPNVKDVTVIQTEHKPWPWMTLGRYHLFQKLKEYSKKDYYYYIDVDMLILGEVGEEIFGERVATIHGKFKKRPGNYDRNSKSLAYISEEEISKNVIAPYFCGGFQGGSKYLDDSAELARRIDIDWSNGVIAEWHDESHWNRYLLDNPPTVVLPHTYCSTKQNENSKISIVKKNEKELRR
jgi:histo-blood group ABO system transferase